MACYRIALLLLYALDGKWLLLNVREEGTHWSLAKCVRSHNTEMEFPCCVFRFRMSTEWYSMHLCGWQVNNQPHAQPVLKTHEKMEKVLWIRKISYKTNNQYVSLLLTLLLLLLLLLLIIIIIVIMVIFFFSIADLDTGRGFVKKWFL
jgi:hypothetical protein